tara:strand:- start:308 stop:529 length:222 start_codon:yes stop_codon:yes gene_type:complete
MLIHTVSIDNTLGYFLVTYLTPGCNVRTVVRICTTKEQADEEAFRLNKEQQSKKHALHIERIRCGIANILEDK